MSRYSKGELGFDHSQGEGRYLKGEPSVCFGSVYKHA